MEIPFLVDCNPCKANTVPKESKDEWQWKWLNIWIYFECCRLEGKDETRRSVRPFYRL